MPYLKAKDPGLKKIWDYFAQIAKIPRPSGAEEKARAFLISWAKKKNFVYEIDKVGNLLVKVPASKDSSRPGVILQGHLDMVCLGKPDPAKAGVELKLDAQEKWLSAKNTTLGADNGVGLAVMMVLAEGKIFPGRLALMLTVDEEKGLVGATQMAFQDNLKNYQYLLNFDSEEEGEMTIGCAGGGDTIITLPLKRESSSPGKAWQIKLKKFKGGHSGMDIGRKHLNPLKESVNFFRKLKAETRGLKLVLINGGQARNAIPQEAEMVVLGFDDSIGREGEKFQAELRQEGEKEATVKIKAVKTPKFVFNKSSLKKSLSLVSQLPHGVFRWSRSVKDLVQTSTNLAIIKTTESNLKAELMTRSSVTRELNLARKKIKTTARKHQAEIKQTPAYPGWEPDPGSNLVKILKKLYRKEFKKPLEVKAIHAGLECGVILGKYPHLEAVSVGPTIQGAHSTKEKVNLPSVERFYRFAEMVLKNL